MPENDSIAGVRVEIPERANYDSLLGAFCAVWMIAERLDARLTQLERQLPEERFALPAAEEGPDV
jgi:hypothetical protein